MKYYLQKIFVGAFLIWYNMLIGVVMTKFVCAQLFSLVALIINTSGRLFSNQHKTLFYNMLSNIFICISLWLLSAYMGLACTILSVVRTFVFYIYAKKGIHKKLADIIIFSLLFIGVSFVGFNGNWFEYSLVALKGLTFTYGAWQHDVRVFRYFSVASNIFTIGYNALYAGYINMINEFICIIFSSILIYKDRQTEKNNETIALPENDF